MGGKAFANHDPPVKVPRLPPDLYRSIRDECIALLRSVYKRVVSPTAAPGKPSHGDIDILVASPLADTNEPVIASMEKLSVSGPRPLSLPKHVRMAIHLLSARHVIYQAANPTTTFAIPHPTMPEAVIQLDVHLCPSDGAFDWLQCFHAHGDLWQIISSACMPFGLSFSDTGLHLRDETVERYERSRKFFLTADPEEILDVLELDADAFWQDEVFKTVDEMFVSISKTRFFRKETFTKVHERPLNSKQRRRLAERGHYRMFREEWIPKLLDSSGEQPESREDVLEDVLSRFDKKQEWLDWRAAWWEAYWQQLFNTEMNKRRKERVQQELDYAEAWIRFLGTADGGEAEEVRKCEV